MQLSRALPSSRCQTWPAQGRAGPAAQRQISRQGGWATICRSTPATPLAWQQQQQQQQHDGAPQQAAQLVDDVLAAVAGSDGGIDLSEQARAQIDAQLDALESLGAGQRPLDSPLLVGNYNVAYTSTSRAQSERGQPAGGRFRSRIGRALFRTTGVFQSVLPPEAPGGPALATNKVAFRLFGLIPGAVGLRGRVVPVAAGEPHGALGKAGERDTCKVLFEPPVLTLGEVHFRIGPPSSVQLSTPYLDERVRLGKGSRGSLFVFTRGGAADEAGMELVGKPRTTPAGLAWLAAAGAAMVGGGAALCRSGVPGLQVLGAVLWAITALLSLVLFRGGIARDDAVDQAQVAQLERQLAAQAAAGGQQPPQQQPPQQQEQQQQLGASG